MPFCGRRHMMDMAFVCKGLGDPTRNDDDHERTIGIMARGAMLPARITARSSDHCSRVS